MTRPLVALFVILEGLDLATYALGAPQYEANPIMRALPVLGVAIAKTAGVALALLVLSAIRTPSIQSLALGIGIAVAAFGVGANTASLSILVVGWAPRPVPVPAPIPSAGTGYERDVMTSAPGRTAAPPVAAPIPTHRHDRDRARVTVDVLDPIPSRTPQRPAHGRSGVASWFAAPGATAAAGPALRALLGRGWRGQRVTVCRPATGVCVALRLTDWCACPHGVIDLSDDAFARLAPLSRGLVRVEIAR